ncbi:flavodoxin domain-containing protein [Puia sp. P3]|uniref:flavodoxin domain-containing protein n=1 Tax=Puia sp. P3 TaxID=3423952 RepID=UPI003D6695FA
MAQMSGFLLIFVILLVPRIVIFAENFRRIWLHPPTASSSIKPDMVPPREYAEWIRKELRIPMIDPERLDEQVSSRCDFLVVGTPVYLGKMLIADWLSDNLDRLGRTRVFLFVVCTYFSDMEKQRAMIKDNIPGSLLDSCEVFFLAGRVIADRLSMEDILLLGAGSGDEPAAVVAECDPVQKGNILPLLKAVYAFATGYRTA